MKSIEIKGKKRKTLGKRSTRELRNTKLTPCVLYGKGEPIHFYTEIKSFKNLVYTPKTYTVIIKLEDNIKINAILKDIQFHPVSDIILHADFYQINQNKMIIMEVPIRLTGLSIGVVSGGILQINMRKLKLKTFPSKLPDEIIINVTKLKIGDKLYINEIQHEDYTLLHKNNELIVSIKMSRSAIKIGENIENNENKK